VIPSTALVQMLWGGAGAAPIVKGLPRPLVTAACVLRAASHCRGQAIHLATASVPRLWRGPCPASAAVALRAGAPAHTILTAHRASRHLFSAAGIFSCFSMAGIIVFEGRQLLPSARLRIIGVSKMKKLVALIAPN
jgi:hypothetical protein